MLLQTNSYIVPKDKRAEHARLLRRFRQVLTKLGCDNFEVYEQVGANWTTGESTGRVVQIMRFRDRKHQLAVQAAERNDPAAQALIAEFCELINFPYQQQRGLFAVGFYGPILTTPIGREHHEAAEAQESVETIAASAAHEEYEIQPEEADAPPAGVVEAGAAAADALSDEAAVEAPAVAVSESSESEAESEPVPQAPEPEQQEAVVAEAAPATNDPAAEEQVVEGEFTIAAEESSPDSTPEEPQPEASAEHPEASVEPSENGHFDEMDLSALLDPHLDHNERTDVPPPLPPPLPHALNGGNGTPPGHRPQIDLSLDGLLEDECPTPDDTATPVTSPESRQNLAHGATRG